MTSKSILIVDDDVTSLEAMRRELGGEPFIVDEAHNGMDALRMLYRNDYDFVLVDLSIPMINGYEILRRVESRQPRATRIALSATSELQASPVAGRVAHAVMQKTAAGGGLAALLTRTAPRAA